MDALERLERIDGLLGTVDQVMQRRVVTLDPSQSAIQAAETLEEANVAGAPVVSGDRVVGMVSLRDLLRVALAPTVKSATTGPWLRREQRDERPDATVGDVMTTSVVSLPAGASLAEAASLMRSRAVNRIPIVASDGVVVGIVARDDVIEAVARAAGLLHATVRAGPLH